MVRRKLGIGLLLSILLASIMSFSILSVASAEEMVNYNVEETVSFNDEILPNGTLETNNNARLVEPPLQWWYYPAKRVQITKAQYICIGKFVAKSARAIYGGKYYVVAKEAYKLAKCK